MKLSSDDRERLQYVCSAALEKQSIISRKINFNMLVTTLVVGVLASLSLSIGVAIHIHDQRLAMQTKISAHDAIAALELRELYPYRLGANIAKLDDFFTEVESQLPNARDFSVRQILASSTLPCMRGYTINQAVENGKWLTSVQGEANGKTLGEFMAIVKRGSAWNGSSRYDAKLTAVAKQSNRLDLLGDTGRAAEQVTLELLQETSNRLDCTTLDEKSLEIRAASPSLFALNWLDAEQVDPIIVEFEDLILASGIPEPILLAASGPLTDTVKYSTDPSPSEVIGLRADYEASKLGHLLDATNAVAKRQEKVLLGGIPAEAYGVSFSLPVVPILLAIPVLLPILLASIIANAVLRSIEKKRHDHLLRRLSHGDGILDEEPGAGSILSEIVANNSLVFVFSLVILPLYGLLIFRAANVMLLGWGFSWIGYEESGIAHLLAWCVLMFISCAVAAMAVFRLWKYRLRHLEVLRETVASSDMPEPDLAHGSEDKN